MNELYRQFARINFYIFSFLVLASGAIALAFDGKTAIVAAKSCFVFAVLLTIGCLVRILIRLNSKLFNR